MDGIIIIDKPAGFTSHDVVAKLRGILRQKKIGHTGTLDPQATGVLPVLLGRATKLSEMLTAGTKTYEAVMRLGLVTDTQDVWGRTLGERPVTADEAAVREVCRGFTGQISQIPPMYSAIKIGGKKLYDLAREGREVERPAREITVYSIEITDISLPLVSMRVRCSGGTYIRTLCHDIGAALGCGAAMQALRRTASGSFTIENAFTLEEVEALAGSPAKDPVSGSPAKSIAPDTGEAGSAAPGHASVFGTRFITLGDAVSDLPRFTVAHRFDRALYNGNALLPEWGSGESAAQRVAVFDADGEIVGIYSPRAGRLVPEVMLRAGGG